jgi:bacterioferritin
VAKDTRKVIDLLNQARARELTAIMQYMVDHYELEDGDFGVLAKTMKKIAIQEMKHAEALAERILFLNGEPGTKADAAIERGQSIPDMLKNAEALEAQAIDMYNAAAAACGEARDHVSKQLFEKLLAEEEDHIDIFQNTAAHVDELGDAFLARLTGEGE